MEQRDETLGILAVPGGGLAIDQRLDLALSRHHALSRDLATRGAKEDDPHGEVLGKVLKVVLGSRRHAEKVARFEAGARAVVKENTSASDDDVNLVLFVRGLLVGEHGEGELDVEGTSLQNTDGVLAGRARNEGLSLRQTDHAATISIAHAHPRPVIRRLNRGA
jgi:hypothetical protein